MFRAFPFVLIMIGIINVTSALPCRTSSGHVCIFPFVYQGRLHTKCTFDKLNEQSLEKQRAWCAYNVSVGSNIMQQWDFCEQHCSLKPIRWWIILLAIGVLIGMALISFLADFGGYLNACRKLVIEKLDGRRR